MKSSQPCLSFLRVNPGPHGHPLCLSPRPVQAYIVVRKMGDRRKTTRAVIEKENTEGGGGGGSVAAAASFQTHTRNVSPKRARFSLLSKFPPHALSHLERLRRPLLLPPPTRPPCKGSAAAGGTCPFCLSWSPCILCTVSSRQAARETLWRALT